MALISGRCKNCNGVIQFDEGLKKGFCSFCGTPFISEEVVNNYNNYYNTQYNIQNANIKIDTQNAEKKIERAEVFLTKIKNNEKADELFKQASEEAPSNYKAWWGLVRTATNDLTKIDIGTKEYERIVQYELKNAFSFAPPDELKEIKEKWDLYSEKIQALNNDYNIQIRTIQSEKAEAAKIYEDKIKTLKNDILAENKRIKNCNKQITNNASILKKIKIIILIGALAITLLIISVIIYNPMASLPCILVVIVIVVLAVFAIMITDSINDTKKKTLQKQIDESNQRIKNIKQQINNSETEFKNSQLEYDEKISKINHTIENG